MDSALTLHRPPLYITAALILALSMLAPSHLRAQPWPSRLNAPYPDANVTAIAATESYVYVSTTRPYAAGGIFRSSDNGMTWDSVSNENHCWQIEASGSHVYALTNNSYVAHSSDNGATWSKENGLNAVAGSAINLIALGDGSVYFLTTNHHVYRSADHGATATDISKTPEFGDHLFWLEGLAAEGSEVYTVDRQHTLFYSLNNGSSWSTEANLGGLPIGRILLASRGNVVMATGGSVYASTDRGISWEEVIDNVDWEIKRMAQNSAAVFLSSSSTWGASIYQSDDRGETWNEITSLDTSVTGIAVNGRYVFLATPGRGVYRYALGSAATEEIGVWQEFALPAGSEQFPSDKQANFVTIDGKSAKVIEAHPDTLIIRAPESLIGTRQGVTTWPDTNRRNVDVVARRARAPGDTVEIARMQVVFVPPRPLLYDELAGPSPALVQGLLPEMGPRWRQSFMFIGRPADGTAAVRITNTTKANQAPATLLGKVISPDNILYDGNDYLTPGNLPNVGMDNASQQFPVSVAGIYLIICEAQSPASAPGSFASPGPFPARFQIHLAGNAGLPQAQDESGRAIRLDTYFNSPAPREQILGNMDPPLGQIAQSGLSKFANPVSANPYPIAVLVPPAKNGFPLGTPPVRSAPPLIAGSILPGWDPDPTVPTARTPDLERPRPGTVIEWSQIPLPASRVVTGAGLPGVARLFGPFDTNVFSLPFGTTGDSSSTIIFDMGSGNEIVDGSGMDFRLYSTSGSYTVAVSNTPFDTTFVRLNNGAAATGTADFDLAGSGLKTTRYVRVTAAPRAAIDALKALNQFIDFVHATAGPMVDAHTATITMRRLKSPVGPLDPYLELISPDGSFLGENESGFGDVTSVDRSDAALVKKQLAAWGFYRFTGKGYQVLPDEQSFGSYFARLETGGEYDQNKILVSQLSEAETDPQRSGNISEARQRNSYLFEAQPGSVVKITVQGGNSAPLDDPVLELYDPEDFLIAASDNAPGRGMNPALAAWLPPAGRQNGSFPSPSTYRIVVSAVDHPGDTRSLPDGGTGYLRNAASGSYTLKLFTGPMQGDDPNAIQITGLAPDAVVQGASAVEVKILGVNFKSGAQVSFSGTGITVAGVVFVNSGELKATVNIAASAPPGARDLTITNPGGQTLTRPGVFHVTATLGTVVLQWDGPTAGSQHGPPLNLRVSFTRPPSGSGSVPGQQAETHAVPGREVRKGVSGASTSGVHVGRSGSQSVTDIQEVEPNNSLAQAQILTGDSLITVRGRAEVAEVGASGLVNWDDIEDLFKVTTRGIGLDVQLDGLTSDCDLYLIDPSQSLVLEYSANYGPIEPEEIYIPDLPAGTYVIGVGIYDQDPGGPDTTAYVLRVIGQFGGTPPVGAQSYAVYRSVTPGAKSGGTRVATVMGDVRTWSDGIPHVGLYYYQVTALYDGAIESDPSNEVTQMVTSVNPADPNLLPREFALEQNYPNPFNPSTRIKYTIGGSGVSGLGTREAGSGVSGLGTREAGSGGWGLGARKTMLVVYDLLGRQVATLVDEEKAPGSYEVTFDGGRLASGMYIYRLTAGSFVQMRKMILVK